MTPARRTIPSLMLPLAAADLLAVRVLKTLALAIAVISAGFALWLWQDGARLNAEAEQFEQAAARVQAANRQFTEQAARDGFLLTDARVQQLRHEVTFANALLERRAFSWTRFLGELEAAVPERIAIASVGLNFKAYAVTLNGKAASLKDVTALVSSLEQHDSFRNAVLGSHRVMPRSPADTTQPAETVDFVLTAVYEPPRDPSDGNRKP